MNNVIQDNSAAQQYIAQLQPHTKVSTLSNDCRLSFPCLFKPKKSSLKKDDGNDAEAKYGVDFLIPKSDISTLNMVNNAINAAYQIGVLKVWSGKKPQIKPPLLDGDLRDDEYADNYKGHYYLRCASTKKPLIIDGKKEYITDEEEIYGGCYCRLLAIFKAYNFNNFNKGISCYLQGIQKVRDGERFGGISATIDDFADLSGADTFGSGGDLPFPLPGETEAQAQAAELAAATAQLPIQQGAPMMNGVPVTGQQQGVPVMNGVPVAGQQQGVPVMNGVPVVGQQQGAPVMNGVPVAGQQQDNSLDAILLGQQNQDFTTAA